MGLWKIVPHLQSIKSKSLEYSPGAFGLNVPILKALLELQAGHERSDFDLLRNISFLP
jgi:hypothetical protein